MEKKIGKSVVATGIAATTIISGGLTHQVHADELVESTVTAPQATEVTGKPVTAADVAVAQENAEAAKAKLDEQRSIVDTAKTEAEDAKTSVKVAEAAARHGKGVWVLDRPNPAGRPVEGLRLRPGWESHHITIIMLSRQGS